MESDLNTGSDIYMFTTYMILNNFLTFPSLNFLVQKMGIKITDKKTKKRGFPGGTVVENLPANAGDTGSSPGLGRSHMPWSD